MGPWNSLTAPVTCQLVADRHVDRARGLVDEDRVGGARRRVGPRAGAVGLEHVAEEAAGGYAAVTTPSVVTGSPDERRGGGAGALDLGDGLLGRVGVPPPP